MALKQVIVPIYERIYTSNVVMSTIYRRNNRSYRLNIMNSEETIKYILEHECSVARFGEGEFELILQPDRNLGFQKHDERLAERLESIFDNENENLLVCIPHALNSIYGRTKHSRIFWSYWGKHDDQHHRIVELIRYHVKGSCVFGDTQLTRPYIAYNTPLHGKKMFPQLKKLWQDKAILFVEGEKTRLGVGNDLFDNAASIKRILCPATNAFDCLDSIIAAVKDSWKGELILLALGPTATVLAAQFADMGMRALDIGHLDIEYEWFLNGAKGHEAVSGKFTNEANGGNLVSNCEDSAYMNQIICRIEC